MLAHIALASAFLAAVHAGFRPGIPLRITTVANSNTNNIQTIVDCNNARNVQRGRSGSLLTCEQLKSRARDMATGRQQCYASTNMLGRNPTYPPVRCRYQGSVETVNVTFDEDMVDNRVRRQPPFSGRLFTPTTEGQKGTGNCGLTLNSIYVEEIIGNYRVISTNGIPDHDYTQYSPNGVCEKYKILIVPRNPQLAPGTSTPLGKGATGVTKSGAALFNQLTDYPVCNAAYLANQPSFGPCQGHTMSQTEWHYHGPSNCLKQSQQFQGQTNEPCPIIGYLIDGFPVRSECATRRSCYRLKPNITFNCTANVIGGKNRRINIFPGCDSGDYEYTRRSDCQLDEASGYLERDSYTYYLTGSYPFTIPMLKGTPGYLCLPQF